jgi:hypothetical protein
MFQEPKILHSRLIFDQRGVDAIMMLQQRQNVIAGLLIQNPRRDSDVCVLVVGFQMAKKIMGRAVGQQFQESHFVLGAQIIKKEVHQKRKRKLQHNRGADTAASLLLEKTFHREAALLQDNSQWTGENQLLSPEDIIRLDELDRLNNNVA